MKKLWVSERMVITLIIFLTTSCNDSLDLNSRIKDNGHTLLPNSTTTGLTSLTTDVWQFATSTPADKYRIGAVSFTIGESAYVGTGFTGLGSNLSVSKDFWKYNPTTNVWTQIADFGGEARAYATGFAVGKKGYVGTGNSIGITRLKDFWEYNSISNQWARKMDFGGGNRESAAGFCIGIKGYIGTGISDSSLEKDFWEYDPSIDKWTRKEDFRGAGRLDAVSFVLDSGNGQLGYLGGGGGFGFIATDFWQYFPVSNIWRKRADLPENFARSGAFAIGSKGYMVANGKLWMFDPLTSQAGSWVQKANFPAGVMYGGFGFSLNGQGYVGGGNYSISVASNATSFYKYIPD